MTRVLRLGTRGSQLALWQAHTVAGLLRERTGAVVEIAVIHTSGDEAGTGRGPAGSTLPSDPAPVAATPGATNVKRMFVKEIEEALLDGRIDLAVHSAKDMPADQPEGLAIGGALPREDPRDALVLPAGGEAPAGIDALRAALGATPRLGTSSIRRVAQLTAAFPGATFDGIRGNLDTRLRKLDAGACDAIVLASAGLTRLGFGHRISWPIPFDVCLPSPGQGIVAIEIRADDEEMRARLARVSDPAAGACLTVERTVVAALGGGCQMPIGAIAVVDGDALDARGIVLSADGRQAVRAAVRGAAADAAAVGVRVADALRAAGAEPLLAAARGQ